MSCKPGFIFIILIIGIICMYIYISNISFNDLKKKYQIKFLVKILN
jgi:hypothetical protein